MRKLDLKNYTYSMPDKQGVLQLIPYQFKNVLVNILTHPNLGLNAVELLEADKVVEKIEKAGLEAILEEEDYELIVDTFKRFRGFSKSDTNLVKRVWNCPVIPEKEK